MKKLSALIGLAAIGVTLLLASNASAAKPETDESSTLAAATFVNPYAQVKVGKTSDTVETIVMAGGYTHFWGQWQGCTDMTLWGVPVPARHPVAVSASQRDNAGNEFIGSAWITVDNVAVGNNVVTARICVNWSSPLLLDVHYVWG